MPLTAGTFGITATATVSGAGIAAQGTASPNGLETPTANASGTASLSLATGTSSGQCDIICAGEFTLAGGASVTWDLYTGTDFKDVFGQTAAFRKLRGVAVVIVSGGDASGVIVGNAASNQTPLFFGAATQTWTVFPSGPPMVGGSPAGIAVGNTTCNLKVANAGAVSVTFRVLLAGTSA
jgi:hypothetical protein